MHFLLATLLNSLSNLALLPVILLALRKRWVVDFVIFLCVFKTSVIYHLCLSEAVCLDHLERLRFDDHRTVWAAIVWVVISSSNESFEISVALTWWINSILGDLSFMLVGTILFPAVLLIYTLTIYGIRIFMQGIPLSRYNIYSLLIGIGFFFIGIFFNWSAPSIFQKDYVWKHPLWHMFSMLGVFFIYAPIRGVSFSHLFSIPPDSPKAKIK